MRRIGTKHVSTTLFVHCDQPFRQFETGRAQGSILIGEDSSTVVVINHPILDHPKRCLKCPYNLLGPMVLNLPV